MRKFVIVIVSVLVTLALIFTALWLIYWFVTSPMKSNWESELKSELTASDSYKEVSESISSLGVMLGQEDSNWIAIDYRDTHAGVVASKAVARTKDGKLYVSSQHFCGFFAAYSNLKQLWELEYPETTESNRMELSQYCDLYGSEGLDDLVVLESTQDPKLQEQLLFLLGFKMDSND